MDNSSNNRIENIELFETMPVPKAVMKLSLPAIIGSLVMMIYNLADTYFVGMLNDADETAAVTLIAPIILAFNAVNNLFGIGSSSMMSRALGKKDIETVRKSSAFGFYCSVLSGILFTILCFVFKNQLLTILGTNAQNRTATENYMFWTVICGATPAILNVVMSYLVKAEGSALHASIGTMSGCLLNIILDPIFILPQGLGMGASGAGCATFISNCVACLYFFILIYVKRKKTSISINPVYLKVNKAIIAGVLAVGIPAAIQNLLNVVGMTILNNFTAANGSDAVAAMGIASKLNMIPLYVALGFSQGIMPLISYNYASQNAQRMKKSTVFSLKIALAFLGVTTVLYFIFASSLIGVFMESPAVVDYGSKFLRGLSLATPFLTVDFMAVGVFQACGMGKQSLIFAIARKLVLEIPMLIILNKFFAPYGIAYAQLCAEVVLAIAATAVLINLFRKTANTENKIQS